jgi:hypothetical protein
MRSCSISLALVLALAGCKPEAASVEFRPVRTVVVDAKPILDDYYAYAKSIRDDH